MTSAPPPLNAMAELTRQNMEMWNRMQEGMLQMLVPPRKPRVPGDPDDEPMESDGTNPEASLEGERTPSALNWADSSAHRMLKGCVPSVPLAGTAHGRRVLPRQHRALALDTPVISAEPAIATQYAMAGNEPGDRVCAHGLADGAACARAADRSRELAVAGGPRAADVQQRRRP